MTKATEPLDALAKGDPLRVLAIALWKNRFRNPDLSIQIREEDVAEFDDCCTFHGVEPMTAIVRPQGRPAQEAVPASPGKRGIAARPAEPPRPYVFVGVVDAKLYRKDGSLNVIKPIENSEENAAKRDEAETLRRYREKAPMLASLLTGMAQSGTFSNAEIAEAAEALRFFARVA